MKSSHQLSGNTNRLDREDDCFADLSPAITVTVKFFSAHSYSSSEPFMVIRQRNRSDQTCSDGGQIPDLGQQMTGSTLPSSPRRPTAALIRTSPRSAAPGPSDHGPAGRPGTGRPRRPSCPGWPPPIRDDPPHRAPAPRGYPAGPGVSHGHVYWERHPDGPFVTLITVAATCCSPAACDGEYGDLISRAGPLIPAMTRSAYSRPSCGKRWPIRASCRKASWMRPSTTAKRTTRRSYAACGVTCTAIRTPGTGQVSPTRDHTRRTVSGPGREVHRRRASRRAESEPAGRAGGHVAIVRRKRGRVPGGPIARLHLGELVAPEYVGLPAPP